MQKLKQQKQFEEISKAQEEVTTTEKLKEQLQSIKEKINHLMITCLSKLKSQQVQNNDSLINKLSIHLMKGYIK